MTPASKSVYYFGFYLLLTGITLVVIPNIFLGMFGIAPTTEIWIRVMGAIVVTIGIYYVVMASANHRLFLMVTVYGRLAILVWLSAFVLMGIGPVQLILFGFIDAAGATWTYLALKKES